VALPRIIKILCLTLLSILFSLMASATFSSVKFLSAIALSTEALPYQQLINKTINFA